MKRMKIFGVLMMLSMVFLINGCSKKDNKVDNCSALATSFTNAASAFTSNPTKQTCDAYIQALKNYVNGCATLTPSLKQTYDQILNAQNCSGF
jgi:uncharacterized lipoprotein YajG